MDITNDDEKAYTFAQTYEYESAGYHRNMISVVVFLYSNELRSMLVAYTVTEMSCFDDYSDDASLAKTIRGNSITTFTFCVDQCITFCQFILLQQHLLPRHR